MKRQKASEPRPQQMLLDQVRPSEADGVLLGAVFSTYSLADPANFFDCDFLPAVFGMGAVRDRGYAVPVALERRLAEADCVLIVDSHAVAAGGRPSLRIPIVVVAGRTQHAKVTLVHRRRLVRLIVSSANLTNDGYRTQREIATVLDFKPEGGLHPEVLAQAIASWKESLGASLRPELTRMLDRAVKAAMAWRNGKPAAAKGPHVFFGGGGVPLYRRLVEAFPAGEALHTFVACSPFWSDGESATPFTVIVDALVAKQVDCKNAELRVLAEADSPGDNALPKFPFSTIQTLRSKDFPIRKASISAVSQLAGSDDSSGDREIGVRPLHAKWCVLIGERSFVALIGSANFTRKGLGTSARALPNMEACVLVKGRSSDLVLERLLPPLCKHVVDVASCAEQDLGEAVEDDVLKVDYPSFVNSVELDIDWVAGADPSGTLRFDLQPERPEFGIAIGNNEGALSATIPAGATSAAIPCSSGEVTSLLSSRTIRVTWSGRSAHVPINISEDSRAGLPSILGAKPDEQQLLAYFHGRLSEESLLEQLERQRAEGNGSGSKPDEETARRFQSYVIREFVESLRGMEDLLAKATAPRTFEQALWGEFSPVALAKEVASALLGQRRSPIAAAFQLAELLRAVASLRLQEADDDMEALQASALDKILDVVERAAQKPEFVSAVHEREFGLFAAARLPSLERSRFMDRAMPVDRLAPAPSLATEVA